MADEHDTGKGGERQDNQQQHQETKVSSSIYQDRKKLDLLKILRWILFLPAAFVTERMLISIVASAIVVVLPNRLGLVVTYAVVGFLGTLVASTVAPNRRLLAAFITCGANLVFGLPMIIFTFSSFSIDQLLGSELELFSSSVQMIALVIGSLLAAILVWFISKFKKTTSKWAPW